MALTLSSFRDRHPEFDKVSDTRVEIAIADALGQTSYAVFGVLAEQAHAVLASHILAMGPTGREARFEKGKGPTYYQTERERLERLVASGHGILPSVAT